MLVMKKIIFICIAALVLFGAGCEDNNSSNQAPSLPVNDVLIPARDELKGEIVQFEGVFCGLSQIDGIKLCFLDDENSTDNLDLRNWFWGIPEIFPSADEHKGEWAIWMLKEFGDIDADNLTDDEIFVVTGKHVFDDCGFYDDGTCIPNVEVERIEVK